MTKENHFYLPTLTEKNENEREKVLSKKSRADLEETKREGEGRRFLIVWYTCMVKLK
jgi:hypothetical protein